MKRSKPLLSFKKSLKRLHRDECGAAFIELWLFVPTLMVFVMFYVICYNVVDQHIEKLQALRYEYRNDSFAKDRTEGFQQIDHTVEVHVPIQGKLAEILGMEEITTEHKLVGYAGCYPGFQKNIYHCGHSEREIKDHFR
jgi:hypothetical protein